MTFDTQTTSFRLDVRVYYEDTDAGGVVYYANYLKFFERARTEWLRSLGINQAALAAQEHLIFVVKKVEIQYQKPAFLDDLLTLHSKITRTGGASITFDQWAYKGDEQLCQSTITVCCVHSQKLRPTALPKQLLTLLDQARN